MSEMHLIQLRLPYSVCGAFTKNKEGIKIFIETGDLRYIYQNELDQACFQHDMAYRDFIDLNEEQLLIKYYVIKHLILQKIRSFRDISVDLLQWFINFLRKNLLVEKLKMKLFLIKNEQKNYANQLLKNLVKEVLFKIHVLLIFIINMHGLFLWKKQNELQVLMLFRKF